MAAGLLGWGQHQIKDRTLNGSRALCSALTLPHSAGSPPHSMKECGMFSSWSPGNHGVYNSCESKFWKRPRFESGDFHSCLCLFPWKRGSEPETEPLSSSLGAPVSWERALLHQGPLGSSQPPPQADPAGGVATKEVLNRKLPGG